MAHVHVHVQSRVQRFNGSYLIEHLVIGCFRSAFKKADEKFHRLHAWISLNLVQYFLLYERGFWILFTFDLDMFFIFVYDGNIAENC